MKVSKISAEIKPSLTRKLFNMAKEYDGVIDLTLGDPDLDSPKEIKNAAVEAINGNKMHYSANAGLIEARKAVSQRVYNNRNLLYKPEENIIITVGGMEALYLSLLSIVDPGDEVIIFTPYYVNYIQMVCMCGGTPKTINAYANGRLFVNEKTLESSITPKTVAIIINSPNNPTGCMFDCESLKIISEIAEKHDLIVISDEVYRTLIYDEVKHESVLQFKDMYKRTILIDSLSKEFSMTGWRIGYACAPKPIIENMTKLQENVAACAPLASQYALIKAYNSNIGNEYIINEFTQRRDFLYSEITKIAGIKCEKPQSTFYMFVDISCSGMTGEEFAYSLLKQEHVAVVPGVAYGEVYSNYIRIAFTQQLYVLEKAVKRIKHFMDNV